MSTYHTPTEPVTNDEEPLALDHETLRDLDASAGADAKGGAALNTASCQAAGDAKTQTSYR